MTKKSVFYLRGDVESLAEVKELTLSVGDQQHVLPCELTLTSSVLRVSFVNPLPSGDYQADVQIKGSSFPLLLTVR